MLLGLLLAMVVIELLRAVRGPRVSRPPLQTGDTLLAGPTHQPTVSDRALPMHAQARSARPAYRSSAPPVDARDGLRRGDWRRGPRADRTDDARSRRPEDGSVGDLSGASVSCGASSCDGGGGAGC